MRISRAAGTFHLPEGQISLKKPRISEAFSMGEGGFAGFRAGRGAALTAHWAVIHSRALRIHPNLFKKREVLCTSLFLNGGRWIRTTEGGASRFTVCPLWPLGNSPKYDASLGCSAIIAQQNGFVKRILKKSFSAAFMIFCKDIRFFAYDVDSGCAAEYNIHRITSAHPVCYGKHHRKKASDDPDGGVVLSNCS